MPAIAIPLLIKGGVFLAWCELGGQKTTRLLAIVDSGSSVTYVTKEARERAQLTQTGRSKTFTCVHGEHHKGVRTRSYDGLMTLGTKSGNGTVYEIIAHISMAGMRIDAILGRDVLRHFKVILNWRDWEGFLEE